MKVYYRNYGCLKEADIIPISALPYEPSAAYEHKLPNDKISKVCKPIWLTANARYDVAQCLDVQGVDPDEYITEATVHGLHKLHKHQGVIYALNEVDITSQANPRKPIPSSSEIDSLFYSKIKSIKKKEAR
jgi:hypothetical protein